MPLQPLEPQRLYRQIAEQLRAGMLSGEFAVGTRLPAERELAVQLGVSRPSVREALIALEVEGWVEVRTGSGVYVLERNARSQSTTVGSTGPATAVSPTEWGPLELIRARRVIEGETAALAASLAQPEHIHAMEQALLTMQAEAAQGSAPLDGDRAFHSAIVQASGNAVLVETVHSFWDARRGPLFTRLGGYFETPRSWRTALKEHQTILAAIRAQDPAAARAAMHAHMDKSHSRLSASWQHATPA
ncbi:transcriptional regulator, GntR family [Rhodoferax sp. OV413]|uniref:FadR/GntR family transcriptional regulator n=1 Tax=Rhodoferax sp. OV413 TaxID=1855285 RepID=UPI00088ADD64|nr:FadR/GntR family transcriptional regulator [Rhodoferax sp. OV413]SDP73047.1 transcriptional regulator, GntR family [Rhodoferax sp. OV413]